MVLRRKQDLQPGDRIVSFAGTESPDWDTIRGDALLSPGQSLPIVAERNGQRVPLTITPTAVTEEGETFGILEFVPDNGGYPVVIRDVSADSAALDAGIQAR